MTASWLFFIFLVQKLYINGGVTIALSVVTSSVCKTMLERATKIEPIEKYATNSRIMTYKDL